MKAGRDDKAFPSLTSVLEFCRKMKSIKSDRTPNHLHESKQVKTSSCSSMWNKNVLKHVFKSNFSSKIVGFSQIQAMNDEIFSCLWTMKFSHACELLVVMYHIKANLWLLGFSNCVYLSWIFWVCDVLGGNNGIFWFHYISAGIVLGWIPSAVKRATLQTLNTSSWFTQGLRLSFQLAT